MTSSYQTKYGDIDPGDAIWLITGTSQGQEPEPDTFLAPMDFPMEDINIDISNDIPASYTMYKRVDKKIKPVPGVFPQEAQVHRQFPYDPLNTLPTLSPNPPELEPSIKITAESMKALNINSTGFLSPEEERLFEHIMHLNEDALAFEDSDRGTFKESYFSPYIFPTIPHVPCEYKNMRIPPGIKDKQEHGRVDRSGRQLCIQSRWGVSDTSSRTWINACTEVSTLANDGPIYDLGWGITPAFTSSAGDVEETSGVEVGDEEGPTYDLRWAQIREELFDQNNEDAQGPKHPRTGADDMRKDDIIDLCDDEPIYDLGQGDGFKEVIDLSADQPSDHRHSNEGKYLDPQTTSHPYLPNANPRSRSPVRGDMDIDGDLTDSSDIEIIEDDLDGTQTILRVNRRLKTIGSTMTDEHIRAIVENVTNGWTECQIFWEAMQTRGTGSQVLD
ncbi:hypothetical protein C8R48DRAFT_775032 [Suillus tomentosus]|nr:hypothetical protein C8R48DRAFT_775032 [Suillus tomentosus]